MSLSPFDPRRSCLGLILISLSLPLFSHGAQQDAGESDGAVPRGEARYHFRRRHDPDGIGKFYMGREIAQVMGHQGADWLERPERASEEKPEVLMDALQLKPGMVVADIGAGTGYMTRRLADRVGDRGVVYAVDIQPEMLELLTNKMARLQIHNVHPILGTRQDPKLPASALDLVLMVDVYHEFDFPAEMLSAIADSLRPGGRVVFVEYRGEDTALRIKPLHKMTEAQVRKEAEVLPLEWSETIERLPRQHIVIFKKKNESTPHESTGRN